MPSSVLNVLTCLINRISSAKNRLKIQKEHDRIRKRYNLSDTRLGIFKGSTLNNDCRNGPQVQ